MWRSVVTLAQPIMNIIIGKCSLTQALTPLRSYMHVPNNTSLVGKPLNYRRVWSTLHHQIMLQSQQWAKSTRCDHDIFLLLLPAYSVHTIIYSTPCTVSMHACTTRGSTYVDVHHLWSTRQATFTKPQCKFDQTLSLVKGLACETKTRNGWWRMLRDTTYSLPTV